MLDIVLFLNSTARHCKDEKSMTNKVKTMITEKLVVIL